MNNIIPHHSGGSLDINTHDDITAFKSATGNNRISLLDAFINTLKIAYKIRITLNTNSSAKK